MFPKVFASGGIVLSLHESNLNRKTTMRNTNKGGRVLCAVACLMMAMMGAAQNGRLLGGDISALPSFLENGAVYRDSCGNAVEPLPFFREQGWNAMRVRLFVEPTNAPEQHKDEGVCQDLPYVLGLCKQIKHAGFQLMLDFHYSDTWADPAKQFTPKTWEQADAKGLCDSVYAYTRKVLEAFAQEGILPEMIQVGNEITFGMLWPTGRVDPMKEDNWDVLTDMLKSGCRACREVAPDAKIIIHTEHAGEWDVTKNYYERLRDHSVDYDVIGLSYYPMWHGTIPNLGHTLDSLAATFPGREVMIVEAAFYYSHNRDRWAQDEQFSDQYPISIQGQLQFTDELVTELLRHPNVDGLFWWFPEENTAGNATIGSWLNRGLFDNRTGRALPSLEALRRYR